MSAPNIFTVTSCIAKTVVQLATTSPVVFLENAASSNSLYKINTIIVSNKAVSPADVTVNLVRSAVSYPLAYTVTVADKSTLVLLGKDTALYLEEADSLNITSSASTALTVICSYEVVS